MKLIWNLAVLSALFVYSHAVVLAVVGLFAIAYAIAWIYDAFTGIRNAQPKPPQ